MEFRSAGSLRLHFPAAADMRLFLPCLFVQEQKDMAVGDIPAFPRIGAFWADRVIRPYGKCFDVILNEAKNLFGVGYGKILRSAASE